MGRVLSRNVAGQLRKLQLSGDRRGKSLCSRLLFDCIYHSIDRRSFDRAGRVRGALPGQGISSASGIRHLPGARPGLRRKAGARPRCPSQPPERTEARQPGAMPTGRRCGGRAPPTKDGGGWPPMLPAPPTRLAAIIERGGNSSAVTFYSAAARAPIGCWCRALPQSLLGVVGRAAYSPRHRSCRPLFQPRTPPHPKG